MDDYRDSTVRSRELGLALRRAVQAKGFMSKDIARDMGWSPTKVSNLLQGVRGAQVEDVAGLLGKCGVTDPKRAELLKMAEDSLTLGWWQEYAERLPAELLALADQEDAAIGLTEFQARVVPGLLQTESYARALMHALPYVPDEEIEERVAARMRRHQIFDRLYPARFRFFVEECVLSRIGFDRRIMSDQIHHLLRMGVRPYVEIRLIPEVVGFHGGPASFHLMDFAEFNPVVFIENTTSALFMEQKETVATFRRIVTDLDRVALDEERSRAWLVDMAATLGEAREEVDEHTPEVAE